jgi:cardiolipin synthase (CMP-forming)
VLKHLPNLLTGLRLLLAPACAGALLLYWLPQVFEGSLTGRGVWAYAAAALFAVAALTDLVDGWAARRFNAESRLGRILDPIADKALVGLPLIVLAYVAWRLDAAIWLVIAICAATIIVRDLLITLFRLFSPDGEGVRVSVLAKWKTTLELVAVGAALGLTAWAEAARSQIRLTDMTGPIAAVAAWLVLLALAAGLSVYTGFQYVRAASRSRHETAAPQEDAARPS